MKRNIKRRAKFREKPFAARLHEQSAEAAFELWMESIIASTLQRISHVTGSSVYDLHHVPYECGLIPEFRW